MQGPDRVEAKRPGGGRGSTLPAALDPQAARRGLPGLLPAREGRRQAGVSALSWQGALRQLRVSRIFRHRFRQRPAAVQGYARQAPRAGFAVEVPAAPQRPGTRAVGVDLGISTFAALSDGGFVPSLKAARRAERGLRKANRALDRKAPGSRGRRKARSALARCHAKAARARLDYLHQASTRLVRGYDVLVLEKLNVKGLAGSALAKDVHDASWAKFISMLRYKAACAGTRLIEVDPRNTSQDCSGCGTKVPKALGERLHERSHCGLAIDRDLNAARNILHRAGVGPGLLNVADCGMRAGGNLVGESVPNRSRIYETLH